MTAIAELIDFCRYVLTGRSKRRQVEAARRLHPSARVGETDALDEVA